MQPEKIQSLGKGSVLRLTWAPSDVEDLPATVLWANCPSAGARRQRLDGDERIAPEDIRISSLDLVGNYAINIGFNDGEARGIYPWVFLRMLERSSVAAQ